MLATQTLFVGRNSIYLPSVDSTNSYAKELIAKSKPIAGTVIWAGEQTAGRGQIGSSWKTEPLQNITATFILQPKFLDIEQQFILNQAVALAVLDLVQSAGLDTERVKIKWPNDIYIDADKVAGILVENYHHKQQLDYSIVGIGLNLNQKTFAPELKNPSSLSLKTGRDWDILEQLSALCGLLEKRYLQLQAKKFDQLKAAYTQQLFRYQETADFIIAASQERIQGQILGINQAGRLVLQTGQGLLNFGIKELIFCI